MSITEFDVRDEYIGTGNTTQYDFTFAIWDLNQLEIRVTDSLYDLVFDIVGVDGVNVLAANFIQGVPGGSITLATNLPTGSHLTILLKKDETLQPFQFRNKGSFTLEQFEKALDNIVRGLQRAEYLLGRTWRIGDDLSDSMPFNTEIPIFSTNPAVQNNVNKVVCVGPDNASLILGPSVASISDDSAAAIAAAAAAEASASAAAVSQAACAAAITGAQAAAATANAAELAAAASASAAQTYATNAATSASNANVSAGAASASATQAESYRDSANAASASASVYQVEAQNSAALAQQQVVLAAAQVTQAQTYAGQANTYAGEAYEYLNLVENYAYNVGATETQFIVANNQSVYANVTGWVVDATKFIFVKFYYTIFRSTGSFDRVETGFLDLQWDPLSNVWSISAREASFDALNIANSLQVTTTGTIGQVQYLSDNYVGETVGKMRFKIGMTMGVYT